VTLATQEPLGSRGLCGLVILGGPENPAGLGLPRGQGIFRGLETPMETLGAQRPLGTHGGPGFTGHLGPLVAREPLGAWGSHGGLGTPCGQITLGDTWSWGPLGARGPMA
jgi:hypothetical protein